MFKNVFSLREISKTKENKRTVKQTPVAMNRKTLFSKHKKKLTKNESTCY